MEINVYDMLVFEDEYGNIYQDCVCLIDRDIALVQCNNIRIYFKYDERGNWLYIDYIISEYDKNLKLKLKEIWIRVNEDTYKKVWSDKYTKQ